MSGRATLVFWALSISFLGSLPLGTLNLGVVRYVSDHHPAGALYFSLAAIVVEMAIVALVLMALKKLEALKRFYTLYSLLACVLLLALAFTMLAAESVMPQVDRELPFVNLHPAIAGFLLSIANPLHLPFWMGWTAALRSRSILQNNYASHCAFVLAIGVGTALAFLAYGIAGHYLANVVSQHQAWLNIIMGVTVLLAALVQAYKTLFKGRKVAGESMQQTASPR